MSVVLEIFLIVRYSIFCSPTGKGLAFQVLSQQEELGCCCSPRFPISTSHHEMEALQLRLQTHLEIQGRKQTSSKGPWGADETPPIPLLVLGKALVIP